MHQQQQLAFFTFLNVFCILFFFKAGAEVIQQEKIQQPTIKKAEPMGRFGGRKPYSSNTEDMEETPTIRILDIPRNTSFQDLLQLVTLFFGLLFKTALRMKKKFAKRKKRGFGLED